MPARQEKNPDPTPVFLCLLPLPFLNPGREDAALVACQPSSISGGGWRLLGGGDGFKPEILFCLFFFFLNEENQCFS